MSAASMKKGSEVDSRRGDNTKEDNDGGMQRENNFSLFNSYTIF